MYIDVFEKHGYKGLKGACNSSTIESSCHGTSGVTNADHAW